MSNPEIINKISKLLEDNKFVSFAYFFGSRMHGNYRSNSDYDIAFYPSVKFMNIKDKLVQQSKLASIEIDIEKIIKTDKIDLVNLDTATKLLRFKVIKNGKLLIEKDPYLHRLRVSRWVLEYLDIKPFLDQRNKITLTNIKSD